MKRARLIAEEAAEVLHALIGGPPALELLHEMDRKVSAKRVAWLPGDLAEIADGCIDLQVVCAGTLSEAGIADVPLIEAVMDANDAKVGGGVDENAKFRKPPGWQPPDIAGLLRAQGWGGAR